MSKADAFTFYLWCLGWTGQLRGLINTGAFYHRETHYHASYGSVPRQFRHDVHRKLQVGVPPVAHAYAHMRNGASCIFPAGHVHFCKPLRSSVDFPRYLIDLSCFPVPILIPSPNPPPLSPTCSLTFCRSSVGGTEGGARERRGGSLQIAPRAYLSCSQSLRGRNRRCAPRVTYVCVMSLFVHKTTGETIEQTR